MIDLFVIFIISFLLPILLPPYLQRLREQVPPRLESQDMYDGDNR